jgi:ATP-dependent Clp protease ATP-binding subunit ClpC
LRDQLLAQGIGIQLTSEARQLLAREGFDPALGARPLRRAIQRLIEDPLSEQLLAGEWLPGEVVLVVVDDGAINFVKGEPSAEMLVAAAPAQTPKATMPTRAGRTRKGGAAGGAAGA